MVPRRRPFNTKLLLAVIEIIDFFLIEFRRISFVFGRECTKSVPCVIPLTSVINEP